MSDVTAADVACSLIMFLKSGRTARKVMAAINAEYEHIPETRRSALIKKAYKIVQDKLK